MKATDIREEIKTKVQTTYLLSKKLSKNVDLESIHDFRVSYKSLRALLRLLKFRHPEYNIRLPTKLKKLYHIAGKIRDAQLQLKQIADKCYLLPRYSQKLLQIISNCADQWSDEYSERIFMILEKKLLRHQHDRLHTEQVKVFFQACYSSIIQLSQGEVFSEYRIHEIRKHLKDVHYICRIIGKEALYTLHKGLTLEKVNEITSIIGKHLDEKIMQSQLTKFARKLADGKEKTLIDAIRKHQISNLKESKHAITTTLKNLTAQLSY